MTSLHSISRRIAALAGRVPTPPSEWPEVAFDLVESGADGRPVTTGRLIHDANTPAGWREVPVSIEHTTKGIPSCE